MYRTYRFEYTVLQEFSWKFRMFNQQQLNIYKPRLFLIKLGGCTILMFLLNKCCFPAMWRSPWEDFRHVEFKFEVKNDGKQVPELTTIGNTKFVILKFNVSRFFNVKWRCTDLRSRPQGYFWVQIPILRFKITTNDLQMPKHRNN